MSDVMPNFQLEQQRLRSQIAAQRSTIEAQKLAILEMADRKRRHEENIHAAEAAISEFETKLASLQQTHGALTEATYREMSDTL